MNPGGTDARVAACARRPGPGVEIPERARPGAAAARRRWQRSRPPRLARRRGRPGVDVGAGRGTAVTRPWAPAVAGRAARCAAGELARPREAAARRPARDRRARLARRCRRPGADVCAAGRAREEGGAAGADRRRLLLRRRRRMDGRMNGVNPGGAGVRAGRGAGRHSTASARRPGPGGEIPAGPGRGKAAARRPIRRSPGARLARRRRRPGADVRAGRGARSASSACARSRSFARRRPPSRAGRRDSGRRRWSGERRGLAGVRPAAAAGFKSSRFVRV